MSPSLGTLWPAWRPPLSVFIFNPDGNPGKGLLLWFVVDDFDEAWTRAQAIGASIAEPPNTDNGTFMRAFVIRDPDGYYVAVNETR